MVVFSSFVVRLELATRSALNFFYRFVFFIMALIKTYFIFLVLNLFFVINSACDAPAYSGLQDPNFLNNLGFQEPASPLMEGLIALHSDIWAIMLFIAGWATA